MSVLHESETMVGRCSVKKVFLEISNKFTGKHLWQSLFLIKLQICGLFFCEFCEISKNTFSYRTPLVAASDKFNIQAKWQYTTHIYDLNSNIT